MSNASSKREKEGKLLASAGEKTGNDLGCPNRRITLWISRVEKKDTSAAIEDSTKKKERVGESRRRP